MRTWSEYEPQEKRLFWRMTLLFIVGNMVFPNIFMNLFSMGILGLVVGVVASGTMTLAVLYGLEALSRDAKRGSASR